MSVRAVRACTAAGYELKPSGACACVCRRRLCVRCCVTTLPPVVCVLLLWVHVCRYKDMAWLVKERRWPPALTESLQAFLQLKSI